MELIIGLSVGLIYSFIAVTNMVLTARYVLTNGIFQGVVASLGTVAAQLVWVIMAVFGVKLLGFGTHSGGTEQANMAYFIVPSSILIFYIAFKIFKAPMPKVDESVSLSSIKSFGTLFAISISRPIRIIGYAALFTAFGAHYEDFQSIWPSILLIVGSIFGVGVFWSCFVFLIALFKNKVTPSGIYKFSKIGSILLFLMGVLSLLSLLK